MRITGSRGIRLVVPLSFRRAVRLSSSAYLMFPPYASTLRPVISSSRACCVPSLSACLGSCLSPLRPAISAAAVQLLLATRPASSTRRAGRYDGVVAVLSALLAYPRHPIRAVRHQMATGCGCLPRFMTIIGAAC